MRRLVFLLAFWVLAAIAGSALAVERLSTLDIRVEEGGWGQASSEAIEETLYAVARVLMPNTSTGLRIRVSHTAGPPITLYERGPDGEYLVRLHASGAGRQLYVYEFAHELAHILSNFDRNTGLERAKRNQWLEESLCEAASLFVLDRLAQEWMAGELAAQGGVLRAFFDILVGEAHRRLPSGYSLAAWIGANEPRMRGDPYLRMRDDLVAKQLLPLFQSDPGGWEALRYLNLDKNDGEATLAQYLGHWYENAPSPQRNFVAGVLDAFSVELGS